MNPRKIILKTRGAGDLTRKVKAARVTALVSMVAVAAFNYLEPGLGDEIVPPLREVITAVAPLLPFAAAYLTADEDEETPA